MDSKDASDDIDQNSDASSTDDGDEINNERSSSVERNNMNERSSSVDYNSYIPFICYEHIHYIYFIAFLIIAIIIITISVILGVRVVDKFRDHTIISVVPGCQPHWVKQQGKCYYAPLVKLTWFESYDRCAISGAKLLDVKAIDSVKYVNVWMTAPYWIDNRGLNEVFKDDLCDYHIFTNNTVKTTSCKMRLHYVCVSDFVVYAKTA